LKLKNKKYNSGISIVILSALYLIGILFIKYNLNDISLTEFRLDYIGNILNILITLLIITGLLILNFRKRTIDYNKKLFLIGMQSISLLTLVFIFIAMKLNLIETTGYLLGFPVKKVYTGILFVLSSALQLYSMLFIWVIIFNSSNMLVLRTLIITFITVGILIIFSFFFVWNVKEYKVGKILNSKYEYGFVPGAAVYSGGKPSPIFEARLREANLLFTKGIIKKILLTGGNAPGEISESESGKLYLKKLNIPDENIILENRSTTTAEQIKYLSSRKFSFKNKDTVVVISDGFHLSRIMQLSKFYKINALGVASVYKLSLEKRIFYRARESVATLLFWFFAI